MKKLKLEKIIAVSGTPGLFKVISNGIKGVIVENILDTKRTIVLSSTKIFSLDTIRVYVQDDERPIDEVLYNLYEVLNHQLAPHHKTASDEEIKAIFEKAVPDYDKERVTISNMRKLMQWYNLLHQANLIEIIETEDNTSAENKNETENKNEAVNNEEQTNTSEGVAEAEAKNPPKKRGRKKKTVDE